MPRISARKELLNEMNQCLEPLLMLQALDSSDSDGELTEGHEYWGSDIPVPILDESDSQTEGEDSDDDSVIFGDNLQHAPREIPPPFMDDYDSETEGESIFTIFAVMHASVSHTRYITCRQRIERSVEFRYTYFERLTDYDFHVITRLSRDTFNLVHDLIKSDGIFYNTSSYKQAPVHWQLACALDRLGNDGNGVSAARSKMVSGVGHGTVFLYYRRVLHALNNIRTQFIKWPQQERRAEIAAYMARKGFNGVVGFVDGTTFPLHGKPGFCGHKYLDRKKRYSVAAQVVCDHQHRILHFMTGMPGSVHDSRYMSQSPLLQSPAECFSPGEYLIADSAYKALQYVVPAYKDNQRDDPRDDGELEMIETFNLHFSRARVVNEHTIGILKARWASLRGLRINLQEQRDIYKVLQHTIACVVLHNLALQAADPWDEEDIVLDDPIVGDNRPHPRRNGPWTVGQRKCYQVRMAWHAWYRRQREGTD